MGDGVRRATTDAEMDAAGGGPDAFTNKTDPPGAVMFVYERELSGSDLQRDEEDRRAPG